MKVLHFRVTACSHYSESRWLLLLLSDECHHCNTNSKIQYNTISVSNRDTNNYK